ncbi:DUF2163 domain-containing protein [uncultured Shimia sp.]|uniref:DUF2163 domain-containing protein n=1 Tax=uncultured Shimia sp. TaxID=573152 RepID=UPI00261E23FF|nr:DUF2163 domain-containing protein [uncultured Shimia sp.]
MAFQAELLAHLQSGETTVARAWGITRKDGVKLGFTDHDQDLSFEGFVFKAATGLTASAIEQGAGLSVDNVEAVGMLCDVAVTDQDIQAGRLDDAEVVAWMVNWANVGERSVVFRGTIGEIQRAGGAFVAELRGLSEKLNMPRGRVYQRPCTAVLGDASCRFDVSDAAFQVLRTVVQVDDRRIFDLGSVSGFDEGWFTRGQLQVVSGTAQGAGGLIKRDWIVESGARRIELWEALQVEVGAGDEVQITAGCDKRVETCREKFANLLNFQGFPDIPGEDWITSYPKKSGGNTGGSLR